MTDPESTAVPRRLDPTLNEYAPSSRTTTTTTSTTTTTLPPPTLHRAHMSDLGLSPRPLAAPDATRLPLAHTSYPPDPSSSSLPSSRDRAHSYSHSQPAPSDHRAYADPGHPSHQLSARHPLALSRSNSQGTTASTSPADPVFTPPTSGGRLSPGTGSAHESSQESQLLQLSQIAAAQARIPEDMADLGVGASRKRKADGMVKHTRDKSTVSPAQMPGHSRNTSTVSVASTAGSRIGELSAELKARLSYAMVKVNHGWQSHSIDQVETLVSHAASPASSASTIHLRNESSTSPQLSAVSHRASNNTTPATGPQHHFAGARPGEPQWRGSPQSTSRGSSASPVKTAHGLAPPVSIQPQGNPRRDPNSRHVPSLLAAPHTSPGPSLHPATSPYLAPGGRAPHRPGRPDGRLVSPHTTVREQDAIETLLFLSSPGNPANLQLAFPPTSSSQPLPLAHQPAPAQQRTALPTARKSLPTGRPPQHARSHSQTTSTTTKRVGFEKSPSAMDIDDPPPAGGSPMSITRGTPRRRVNGNTETVVPRLKHMPLSAGLTVASKPRPRLGDDEIDRMLDRAVAAAEEESDSEGEICLGVGRRGVVGV
ncbi:hypothetical protein C8A05DRAFT_13639 [Staphylotrichum tortipilum]|uniref:Uncharacterized protein n=1 Tax=Staphylotrichum tortipilum TaxID=2831512 RepID=A0AAN6MQ63_9PEZI|nr:hypothetical protein C8A05DRAFT_13639 [Staphylotrichum longicolle]